MTRTLEIYSKLTEVSLSTNAFFSKIPGDGERMKSVKKPQEVSTGTPGPPRISFSGLPPG